MHSFGAETGEKDTLNNLNWSDYIITQVSGLAYHLDILNETTGCQPRHSGRSEAEIRNPVDFVGFWMPDRVRHDGLTKRFLHNILFLFVK